MTSLETRVTEALSLVGMFCGDLDVRAWALEEAYMLSKSETWTSVKIHRLIDGLEKAAACGLPYTGHNACRGAVKALRDFRARIMAPQIISLDEFDVEKSTPESE